MDDAGGDSGGDDDDGRWAMSATPGHVACRSSGEPDKWTAAFPARRWSGKPLRGNRGSVLIVVLWACLGLVAITLTFGHSMLMTYRGTDNDFAGRQADQAIEGAARYAETLFVNATTPGLFPELTSYEREAVPVGEATFWFLGRPLETGNGTTREYSLVDEASKLNLNTATEAMLKLLPGMTDDLAAAIVAWRTAATSTGATTSTSSSTVKGGPFESIEELALVSGATREILYGEDANMNGVLDANEDDGSKSLPEDNSDGKLDPGILEYVTVFSRESNKQTDGTTNRINIANLQQVTQDITTLLDDKLGSGRAEKILPLVSAGPPMQSVLEFYTRAKGDNFSEDDFGKIAYELTVVDPATKTTIEGLINVNTASETVLGFVLGTDNASKLVAARASRTVADTNYAWIVDVLAIPNLLPPTLSVSVAMLTGKCSQATADIAAVGRNGRGYRRSKIVIDVSGTAPKIIYRRNLSGLGWALGSDVRETFAMKKEPR